MLGKNLEEILKLKEITLTELSKATSVPRTTLIGWVKGTSSSPNLEQLDRVASFLNVSIEQLAFGRKQKEPELSDLINSATIHTGLYKVTVEKVSKK